MAVFKLLRNASVSLLLATVLLSALPLHAQTLSGTPATTTTEQANENTNFQRARAVANQVLAQPQFQSSEPDTWWTRLRGRLLRMLDNAFSRLGRAGKTLPWLARALEWTLFTGAAVGLLFFVLRQLRRQRMAISLTADQAIASAWSREADDWSQRARAFAAQNEWREAVHCLYWAAIVLLESRRAWRHNPTRTPREYVRLLRAGSAQQTHLRGLTQLFERTWYGLRETSAADYNQARAFYDGLSSTQAAPSAMQPAVAEAL